METVAEAHINRTPPTAGGIVLPMPYTVQDSLRATVEVKKVGPYCFSFSFSSLSAESRFYNFTRLSWQKIKPDGSRFLNKFCSSGVSVHHQSGVTVVGRTCAAHGGRAGHVSLQAVQGGADSEHGPCGQGDCESGTADFQAEEKAGGGKASQAFCHWARLENKVCCIRNLGLNEMFHNDPVQGKKRSLFPVAVKQNKTDLLCK